jgi:predicted MPP superfamily phosphohydrolase
MIYLPIMLLGQVLILFFMLDMRLTMSEISVDTAKIDGQVNLALITDLHGAQYGQGQRQLLARLETANPDAVLLCGDIYDDRFPLDSTMELITGIGKKYPCFYVTGNHDLASDTLEEFKDTLRDNQVKILSGDGQIVQFEGGTIWIGGIEDPETDRYANGMPSYKEQLSSLDLAMPKDLFTVILSHRPERMKDFEALRPDLVVAGHGHGGQWRIPVFLKNGLYAPNQGLFPKFTNGLYSFGETSLVVSRGLSQETILVPRVFNPPELVIVRIG